MAHARTYDIYRADYVKGAFCSVIAGACAADTDFDSSFFQNPATLTIGGENWDYDYDFIKADNLEPGMSKDNAVKETTFMFSYAQTDGKFGWGISFTKQTDDVSSTAGIYDDTGFYLGAVDTSNHADTYDFNIPLSWRINPRFSLGVGLEALFQNRSLSSTSAGTFQNNSAQNGPSLGFSTGFIYDIDESSRFGSWFRSAMTQYQDQTVATTIFADQINFQENITLNMPWQFDMGYAKHPDFLPGTLFFDLNVVGSTPNGYLLSYDNFTSALNNDKLITKGRNIVIDPRLGYRGPWWSKSAGTLSLGTYYENSRYQGYDGRWHFTGGLAYKFDVHFFIFDGIEFMSGIDVAKDFAQIFFTYR